VLSIGVAHLPSVARGRDRGRGEELCCVEVAAEEQHVAEPVERARIVRVERLRLEEPRFGRREQWVLRRSSRLDRVPVPERVGVLDVVAVETDDDRVERPLRVSSIMASSLARTRPAFLRSPRSRWSPNSACAAAIPLIAFCSAADSARISGATGVGPPCVPRILDVQSGCRCRPCARGRRPGPAQAIRGGPTPAA
jgi:hypothetical protein